MAIKPMTKTERNPDRQMASEVLFGSLSIPSVTGVTYPDPFTAVVTMFWIPGSETQRQLTADFKSGIKRTLALRLKGDGFAEYATDAKLTKYERIISARDPMTAIATFQIIEGEGNV